MGKIFLPPKSEFVDIISAKYPCPRCKEKSLVSSDYENYSFLCPHCGEIVSLTNNEARKIVAEITLNEHIQHLEDIKRYNPEEWTKVIYIDHKKDKN